MFHDGQYLEVIKASDNCLATVIVTVKEKVVKIDKEKISTNKWLSLEDWYELYKIIQKAILRNSKASKEKDKCNILEKKKSTKRLDIVYTIEPPEDIKSKNSLPTVKVRVSPAKRLSRIASTPISRNKTETIEKTNQTVNEALDALFNTPEAKIQRLMGEEDPYHPEEYVPTDLVNKQKIQEDLKYVPSRKSLLRQLKQSNESNSNEYSPPLTIKQSLSIKDEVGYVPNPISSLEKVKHDVYDPCGVNSLPRELSEAYIPSSKSSNSVVEEYQPNFPTKAMQFDDSYVPSLKKSIDQTKNKDIGKKRSRKENEIMKARKKMFLDNNKKPLNDKNPKQKF
ncbi:uncharacterized protein [Chelonus insularis]|uniref:uncharacterized protein n=1 Tax=Chelonus insularis TaxID=460826 RepID=UPI00158EE25F|nr:uncharacterized protein LOC118068002 [Chelonus insularis]